MKVISLIENTSSDKKLACEHGLSIYLEKDDKKYLLDTGASGDFIDNASNLGVDLTKLDAVIISHNHYDHIGGLEKLLNLNKTVKVYIKSQSKNQYYLKLGPLKKYIGERKGLFEDFADRFIFIDDSFALAPNLYILSNEVNNKEFFCQDTKLCKLENGKLVKDDFKHELFLVSIENDELVVISSCSHNGIVNIIETTSKHFPGKTISNFIGGLHMQGLRGANSLNCTTGYIDKVLEKLAGFKVEKIYTGHCTGMKAYNYIKSQIGDKINYFETGQELTIN